MARALRWAARVCVLLTFSVVACSLGMRDKDSLSGGGASGGTAGSTSDAGPCSDGYEDCDGIGANGCETFVLKDPKHCGGCGKACFTAGNTAICDNGVCGTSTCSSPSLDCDGDPATCETNSETSAEHCGFCGNACKLANAVQKCAAGACTFDSCQTGYADCDGVEATGCEASLSSAENCGSCGAACAPPNATGACSTGTCGIGSCNSGYADCDKTVANGCESNLQTDPGNCGACGKSCATGQACKAGQCEVTSCVAPMADCDANPDCETNVQTSLQHCGFCNNACNLPNATASCNAGKCEVASCSSGFGDCDTSAPGCETTLGTTANCTACGDKCGGANVASAVCTTACQLTCSNGYANCDSNAGNGCEVSTASDPANCGACGTNCAASAPPHTVATCESGQCKYDTCQTGWGDCTGAAGCETNLTTASNCGACGRSCTGCNGGYCPVESVGGLTSAAALDFSGTSEVVVGCSPGGIHRVAKSTLTVSTPHPNANATSVDALGNDVFWADPAVGVRRAPLTGGVVTTVTAHPGIYALDANATQVFFTSPTGLRRVGVNGGAVTEIDSQPARGLRQQATVFWAGPSQILSVPGGGPYTVATHSSGESSPESVAQDGTYVFWTNNGDGRIRRAPIGGGPAVTIATGQTGAFGIASEATDIYWTTNIANGGIYKAPKAGGPVVQLAANCAFPRALAIDNTHVYWVETGSGTLKRVQR